MPDKLKKWLPLIALFAIYLTVSYAKVILTVASPYYDGRDETNLHFTENAVQYRYAKMIAEGEGLPEVDTRIQHPEGVRVSEELTVTLERISGNLYRFLAIFGYDAPFHTYSVYFIAFFSSLAVFSLYLAGSRLWGGWLGGLLVVCFYVVMPPAWMRTITSFSREDFALTFLFTGLTCFGLSLGSSRQRWMPWVAGAALSVAAISWHITNFALVILFAYAILTYFVYEEERDRIFESLWPILLLLFVIGLGSDLLRNKWFVVSSTMLVGYGLLAAHLLGERLQANVVKRIGIFVGFPVLAHLILSFGVGEHYRAYSHAFDVIYYKIRFGLIKPDDPTLMNYDARGMWSSSFRSPSLGDVWSMFSTLLIVSGGAAILSARDFARKLLKPDDRYLLYCFVAFLFCYIAFDRIQVFFVFFAALMAGRWLIILSDRKSLAALALVAFIGYEIYNDTRLFITVHRTPGLDRLVTWVRENTAKDDVILTAFHIGPSILTYTDRPIVQHPKFESHIIREKSERFLEGLFSTEDDFYGLAKEWEADWYVYQASMGLDTSLESPRYVAGRTSTPSESALFHFQFAADRLEHFHLVYQDHYYRIFKIGDPPSPAPSISYQPMFDLNVFNDRSDGMPSDEQIERVSREIGSPETQARIASALYVDGRFADAAAVYQRLADKRPKDTQLLLATANAYDRAGDARNAIPNYLKALSVNPNLPRHRFETANPTVFREGARMLIRAGKNETGIKWLEMAVNLAPDDAEASTNLGILYSNEGKNFEAREAFERAEAVGGYPLVYLQLGLLEQKEGNHEAAVANMEKYLSLDPASPNRSAIRQAIERSRSSL